MANVVRELERIENATYGEEVRSSIHDAIDEINKQAIESYETAVESQESCLNSKNAAETAQRASEIARSASENAKISSETARDQSILAKQAAEQAKTDLETARDTAISAKNAAETAKNQSEEILSQVNTMLDKILQLYQRLQEGFIPKGNATVETLPDNPEVGWLYIITEDGITTEDFAEGPGQEVKAGSSVYYTADSKWSIKVSTEYMYVTKTELAEILQDALFINALTPEPVEPIEPEPENPNQEEPIEPIEPEEPNNPDDETGGN